MGESIRVLIEQRSIYNSYHIHSIARNTGLICLDNKSQNWTNEKY